MNTKLGQISEDDETLPVTFERDCFRNGPFYDLFNDKYFNDRLKYSTKQQKKSLELLFFVMYL